MRPTLRTRWQWVALAFVACSGQNLCRGSKGSPANVESVCLQWATHFCARLESCAPLSIQVAYGDEGQCVARNRPQCEAALRAPGTGQTAPGMESCARAYESASCDEVVVGKPPAPCAAPGSLPLGAPCGDDSQCAGTGTHCRIADRDRCGICAMRGPVGAACDSDRDCEYGLVCYFTCMQPVTLDAPCDGMTRQCPSTLICLDYKCVATGQVGAACKPRADHCDHDHGLYCDSQTQVCARYAVADRGAACGSGTICKAGSCTEDEKTHAWSCVGYADDGSRCDAVSGPHCAAPARCIDGICLTQDPSACR